jgi:hypothetical protein
MISLCRYKYENNRIMDASSPDGSSYSQSRSNGNNKLGTDTSNKGTYKQLRERQVIFNLIKI